MGKRNHSTHSQPGDHKRTAPPPDKFQRQFPYRNGYQVRQQPNRQIPSALRPRPTQRGATSPTYRHAKDQKFIDLAYYGEAHCLLTEDYDLLDMADQVHFAIINSETLQDILANL